MRKTTFLTTMLLVTAGFALAGSAQAHTCASYDGDACDPNGCTEGEAHDHTHLRYWWEGDDEHCESEPGDPQDPSGCSIFGIDDWPEVVCDLIHEGLVDIDAQPVASVLL